MFTDGNSTTRTVAENTVSGQNIGTAVAATDADNDTLTYTLSGTDAAAFDIVSTSGQLQTKAALDFETKKAYSVRVSVTDGKGGSDSISVTINVTNVNEINPPLRERTPQVRDGIVRAVPGVTHADDVTDTHLAAITSLDLGQSLIREIITSLKSGDFNGLTSLRLLELEHNSLSNISPLAGLTSLTQLDLSNNSLSDISPLAGLTSLKILGLADNSISDISHLQQLTKLIWLNLRDNSISDVSHLQQLTKLGVLHLSGNPISDYAPLRSLKTAKPDVDIDIDFDNNLPVFSDGDTATRTIAENTVAGINIGDPISATDADNDPLTYSLGGDDAAAFRIVSTSGQLQTRAALDFEMKGLFCHCLCFR